MDQDSGSQNTRCFAQQKAVAVTVSGGDKMEENKLFDPFLSVKLISC